MVFRCSVAWKYRVLTSPLIERSITICFYFAVLFLNQCEFFHLAARLGDAYFHLTQSIQFITEAAPAQIDRQELIFRMLEILYLHRMQVTFRYPDMPAPKDGACIVSYGNNRVPVVDGLFLHRKGNVIVLVLDTANQVLCILPNQACVLNILNLRLCNFTRSTEELAKDIGTALAALVGFLICLSVFLGVTMTVGNL